MPQNKEKSYVSDNDQLMAEWNWIRNNESKHFPEILSLGSECKVWWICTKGHQWQAAINHRNNGRGCPYCAGKKVLRGYNDLTTINPTLAKEWNYNKNDNLIPENFTANSGKKVWWVCKLGHEWQATIYNRNYGNDCPFCNAEQRTSFPEYVLFYYLQKCGLDVVHSYKARGYELDIYIPSKKVAIEYDGYYWHKNKREKDLQKNKKCEGDGIVLYRIREGLPSLNDTSIDITIKSNQADLPKALSEILSRIVGYSVDIDIERDYIEIENIRVRIEKKKSFLLLHPDKIKEWNTQKNSNLKPEDFYAGSDKKVWWVCSEGHEWQARIAHRSNDSGCPYCAGKKVLKGYNDLKTTNPILAIEWNYNRNGNAMPEDFSTKSGKKVWWICKLGHEWQAVIYERSQGTGCPYCSNNRVLIGYNDLITTHPELVREWDYERNFNLKPENYSTGAHQKIWWKCIKGHEWVAPIYSRTNGTGCPYCANKKVLSGYNDLATHNPMLASEWDYKGNDILTPADVLPNSNKKVWWKCIKGHTWQAIIANRSKGSGCPYCSGRKKL